MTPKISLLLPTRNRPQWVRRLFDSLMQNTKHPESIEIVLYLDDDDPARDAIQHPHLDLVKISGPRSTMGAFNTACMHRARGDIRICINDDMVFRTPGWDKKIIALHESVPDGIYLAWANDLFIREKLCPIPILSRKTCEILQNPYPNQYPGGFIDYHLFDIFQRLRQLGHDRLHFLGDVVVEHLHFLYGKSEYDDTYSFRGQFDVGEEAFLALGPYRQVSAERLSAAIEGNPLPPLPAIGNIRPISPRNREAIAGFWRNTIADSGLPIRWRFSLFKFLSDRYLAKKYQLVVNDRPLGWKQTIFERMLQCVSPGGKSKKN